MDNEDTVTITRYEFDKLVEAQKTLHKLEAAGVDNWGGMDHIDWDADEEEGW